MTQARRPAAPRRSGAGEVRIIAGQWKRSRLTVVPLAGLRPTPDRVRETLFNWLGIDLSGWRVLDAFAGSGALGLEAASRGAAQVTLLERDGRALSALRAAHVKLGASAAVQLQQADAMAWMARAQPGTFELVFLDPPFDSVLLPQAMELATRLLAPMGLLAVESPTALLTMPNELQVLKSLHAGAVHIHLLQRAT